MLTFPNQKIVTIHKEETNKNNLYTCINLEALKYAFSKLSYSARCLWIMLASNQNNYRFALSRKDAISNWNIKSTTYDKAIKELIEEGFLYQEIENSNEWIFRETDYIL